VRRRELFSAIASFSLVSTLPRAVQTPAGRTFIPSLASAPYPHPSRASGDVYDNVTYDAATHYRDSTVGIYIPPSFTQSSSIDAIVHVHGWRNQVAEVFRRYREPLVIPSLSREAPIAICSHQQKSRGASLDKLGMTKKATTELRE
jgi:hypothetical protein